MSALRCGLLLAALLTATGCRGVATPFGTSAKEMRSRLDIARLHERDGQLSKARDLYGELHGRRSHQAEVCQRLAIVNSKLGDFEAARGYFAEAVEHDPDNAEVLTDFGYALLAHGEYEPAEKMLSRALQLDAQNRRAMNNLGLAVAHQGRSNEALQHFRRANGEAAAHANLAYVLAQRGEGRLAIAHYSHALTLDSELPAGQQGLLQIAQMQRLQNAEGGLDASNIAKKAPANDEAGGQDGRVSVAANTNSNDAETAVQLAKAEGDEARPDEGVDAVETREVTAAASEATPETTTAPVSDASVANPPATAVAAAASPEVAPASPDAVGVPTDAVPASPEAVVVPTETLVADAAPVEPTVESAPGSSGTEWETSAVEIANTPVVAPAAVPAATPSNAKATASPAAWERAAPAKADFSPAAPKVVPVEFTSDEEETRDVRSAAKVERTAPDSSVITAPTWVADSDGDDDVWEDAKSAAASSEVSVRWQQLTISHAEWGGKQQALDVCHRAALDLARNVEFTEVIRNYSDDEHRAEGGHVDWTVVSQIDEELRPALTRLAPGVISRIIAGEHSYRLVRVTDRRGGASR